MALILARSRPSEDDENAEAQALTEPRAHGNEQDPNDEKKEV